MSTNIKIVEHVVQELPSERPLVRGEKYKVMQSDGTLIEYVVNSQGEPVRLKGITNDESSRLNRLSSDQISKVESITTGDITKLKEDYTKSEIDTKISDLGNLATSSKVSLGNSTVLPVPPQSEGVTIPNAWVELAQNVTYTQSGGSPITGIDGHRSIAEWDNDNEVWSLVDLGELPKSYIEEYEVKQYPEGATVIFHRQLFRSNKVTSTTPPSLDWDNISESVDAIHDGSATISFNTETGKLNIGGTFLAALPRRRQVAETPVELDLMTGEPIFICINTSGVMSSVPSSQLSGIEDDSLSVFSYRWYGGSNLFVTGLDNYIINGVTQNRNEFFFGIKQGRDNGFRFNVESKVLEIRSTNVIVYNNKRLTTNPQTQDIPLPTSSGTYVIYVVQEAGQVLIKSIVNSNIGNIPFGSVILGTYQIGYNGSGDIIELLVSGIDGWSIGGTPEKYLGKSVGQLITQDERIDIRGQELHITGGALVAIGRDRYLVNQQVVSFSSSPSIFYLIPSTGVIGSVQSSSIGNLPLESIIIGGHYGAVGWRFQFWGFKDYLVQGQNSTFWEKKLRQKKYLVDFDPRTHYYICDTTLSMTDDDPEPLIGSDPNIMNARYDDLMLANPTLFSKETIATISTSLGDRPINVYTFTPPSVSTDPRPDSGIVVVEPPHIFINCSIHGNEKTASIACYQFIEDMLAKWQDSKVLEWFRFNVKLSIIPTANPAGWVNGTRTNGNGVDLNRNFPFRYISNQNPGSTTWSGLSTLDQPESLAINTWMEDHKKDLLMVVDFHNFFGEDGNPFWLINQWTEGVSQFTNQLGRIAAQQVSRGSRSSSEHFPTDVNHIFGTSSYVVNTVGRLAGQANDILPYGLTFEISQNFRFNPNWKANDNDAIRLGTESFGNSLTQFVWHCMQDYNSKESVYDTL